MPSASFEASKRRPAMEGLAHTLPFPPQPAPLVQIFSLGWVPYLITLPPGQVVLTERLK